MQSTARPAGKTVAAPLRAAAHELACGPSESPARGALKTERVAQKRNPLAAARGKRAAAGY